MTTGYPEAVTAATDALLKYWGNPEWGAGEVRGPVTKVLEAAAPVIAAAERERIRQLARGVHASYALDQDAAMSVLREFADLLGDAP